MREKKTERLLAFLRKYTGKPVGTVFVEYPPDGEGTASKIAPRLELVAIVAEGEQEDVFILKVTKR